MALTDAQIASVYEIFGLPNKSTAFGVLAFATFKGPAGEVFTLSGVKTQLDAALAALTTDEQALFTVATTGILAEWDKVKNRHQKIIQDGSTQGVIFDAAAGKENVRQRASVVLGFYAPRGGFQYMYDRFTGQGMRGGSVIR